MQGCNPAVRDRDGCTPLYCAAAWNRTEAVKALDALGCPSWAKSEEGRTAVHVAAEQGWTELIELLVRQFKNKVGRGASDGALYTCLAQLGRRGLRAATTLWLMLTVQRV
jgi:ankyrin repeat protein